MATIKHRALIKATRAEVYRAISTKKGLENWWTSDVQWNAEDKVFVFGFRNHSIFIKMDVFREQPDELLIWNCSGEPTEWIGTEVRFKISEREDGMVQLDFQHDNWLSDEGDFPKCNTDWGHLMYFLKDYLEGRNTTPFMS